MQPRRRLSYLGLLVILACAGPPPPASAPSPPSSATPGLRPGDAVRVEIWQESDLSGDFTVSASGNVVFPLLGERKVSGTPAARLEEELTREYREFLENPSVSVTVLKRIAIYGEVRAPNLYMVDATVTLMDALAMAGGILPTGNRRDVRLIRDGNVIVANLDLNRPIGDMSIQSGDHIEVGPESWVSRNRYILTAGIGAFTSILAAVIVSR